MPAEDKNCFCGHPWWRHHPDYHWCMDCGFNGCWEFHDVGAGHGYAFAFEVVVAVVLAAALALGVVVWRKLRGH